MSEVFIIYLETQNYDDDYPIKEIQYVVETEQEAKDFVDNKIAEAYEYFRKDVDSRSAVIAEEQRIYEALSDDAKRVLFPRGGPTHVNKWQLERGKANLEEYASRYYDRGWSYEKYKTGLPDGA